MNTFRNLYKLTSWVLPTKHLKLRYKDFCTSLDLRKDLIITQENYKNVLARLKNKKDKIRVIFLIRENQKWTYQSVYEKFDKSQKFEPLILVSLLELVAKGKDKTRNNLEENYNFFKSKGMNVDYAYKNGQYIDLNVFKPDIVFYDQEWDLPKIHKPKYISSFALTCYCPYGYELLQKEKAYTQDFHRFLYKFFVEHQENIKRYKSYNKHNIENCVLAGYPKLDAYLNANDVKCNLWKDDKKFKVIYAPHHSFEKNDLRLATFAKNEKFILELAKKHPETTWVFKPHPRFKYALLKNKIMNESEVNNYYEQWNKIGKVYDGGNNFELMFTSDLMITDCCSFLAEYVPTKKPLIRLTNSKGYKLNNIGRIIMEGYYTADNCVNLEHLFEKLINSNNDNKKRIRESIKKEIIGDEPSAGSIYKFILNDISDGGAKL